MAARSARGTSIVLLAPPTWPFDGEETTSHYLSHLAYGVTQLPLLYMLSRFRPWLAVE